MNSANGFSSVDQRVKRQTCAGGIRPCNFWAYAVYIESCVGRILTAIVDFPFDATCEFYGVGRINCVADVYAFLNDLVMHEKQLPETREGIISFLKEKLIWKRSECCMSIRPMMITGSLQMPFVCHYNDPGDKHIYNDPGCRNLGIDVGEIFTTDGPFTIELIASTHPHYRSFAGDKRADLIKEANVLYNKIFEQIADKHAKAMRPLPELEPSCPPKELPPTYDEVE